MDGGAASLTENVAAVTPLVQLSADEQQQQLQQRASPRDVPSVAESRAFFQKQESLRQRAQSPLTAFPVPRAPSAGNVPVNTVYPPSVLLAAARIIKLRDLSAPLDASLLPLDISRWTDELEGGSRVSVVILDKLERCQHLLQAPAQVDWKITRHPVGDTHPYALFDALLDAFLFIVATTGLLDGSPALWTEFRAKIDELSLCPGDGRKVVKVQFHNVKQLNEVEHAALLELQEAPAFLLEAIRRLRRFYLPIAGRRSLDTALASNTTITSAEAIEIFRGVEATTKTGVLRSLLTCPQVTELATDFQALGEAVRTVSNQRRLLTTPSATGAANDAVGHAASKLAKSARDWATLAGVLSPFCETPVQQEEFTDAFVLAAYLLLRAREHYEELSQFTRQLLPAQLVQDVRKRIRSQSAAVNVAFIDETETPATPNRSPRSSMPNAGLSAGVAGLSAASSNATSMPVSAAGSLSSAVRGQQQQNAHSPLLLVRPAELDAMIRLWFLKPLSKLGAAPANHINHVLAFFAWEGDADVPSSTGRVGEEEALAAVLRGARVVYERVAPALSIFQEGQWSGRGDDVISFATRCLEALHLVLRGEAKSCGLLDMGAGNKQIQVPRWRRPLFSVRRPEVFAKFVFESIWQKCFYVCPIQRWNVGGTTAAQPSSCTPRVLHPFEQQRLAGAVVDLELRQMAVLESTTKNAELTRTIGLRLGNLEDEIAKLHEKLKDLTDGAVDRHANQIKSHTDLIAALQKEMREMNGRLKGQQKGVEQAATDSRRAVEQVLEMQESTNELQVKIENAALLAEDSARIRPDLLARIDTVSLHTRSELVPKLTNLSTDLRDLAAKVNEVQSATKDVDESNLELRQKCAHLDDVYNEIGERVAAMRTTLPDVLGSMSHAILDRAKHELQEYVTAYVQQLVAEALNSSANRPPAPRRSRLGFWTPGRTAIAAVVPTPMRQEDDEVSNAEETASVMEENSAAAVLVDASGSWFPDGTTVGDVMMSLAATPGRCGSDAGLSGLSAPSEHPRTGSTASATPRRREDAARRLSTAVASASAALHP